MNDTLSMAASLAQNEALIQGVESAVRHIGYNLPTAIGAVNIKAIGFIIALVFLALLLIEWLSYSVGSGHGDISTYSSYGRSLLSTAADIWDQRNLIGRNGRSMESLEPMVEILDSISKAIHKWDNKSKNGTKEDPEFKSRVLF